MIFPDKPRPPWRPRPRTVKVPEPEVQHQPKVRQPLPPGYWRERIELTVIVIGMIFWIKFWLQFK